VARSADGVLLMLMNLVFQGDTGFRVGHSHGTLTAPVWQAGLPAALTVDTAVVTCRQDRIRRPARHDGPNDVSKIITLMKC
jgi:hypothetical protein